ncbi:MAG: MMPL family transporter, partial [Sphingomonadales bacterium]
MNLAITTIHKFLSDLTGFSLRKPAVFLGFMLVFTAFAGWFLATNVTVRTNTDEMIDANLPFRVTYDDFNRTFPQFADSFIIVIDGDTPEAAEAAQRRLYAGLSGQKNLYSNVFTPGLGDYFETNAFLLQDYEKLLQFSDDLAAAQPVLAAVSEDQSLRGLFGILNEAMDETLDGDLPNRKLPEVLADFTEIAKSSAKGQASPLSWQSIFLEDEDLNKARRRLILVQPVLDFTKLVSAKEALLAARAAAAEIISESTGVTIRFTGKMALNADELKSVSDGAMVSGILSFILVALVLGFGIRSIRIVASALITLFIGLVWTGAFAMLTVGYFNIISIAFAVLFIGLGIDFAIHFALRFQEEAGAGMATDEALIKTAVTAGTPLALCAPTTALAFFAFVPTEYAGLAQLGLISGTGIFVAFFTSMTILPALLKLMHIKKKKIIFNRRAKADAGFIARNGRNVAVVGFLLGAVALVVGLKVSFDFDPINLKDPKTESVTSFFDLLEGEKTSPYAIQVVAENAEAGEALKPEIKALSGVD